MLSEHTSPAADLKRALDAVDDAAARGRRVAEKIIAAHGDTLPWLLAISLDIASERPELTLQPYTADAVATWADALGAVFDKQWDQPLASLGYYRHTVANVQVDGVDVRIASAEWNPQGVPA